MPNTETNAGLSLEALLAAAQNVRGEEEAPARESDALSEERSSSSGATAADSEGSQGGAPGAGAPSEEPATEPSAAVQREAAQEAESAAPAFDLAAALGYGSRSSEPSAAVESKAPEEKFDLAAALGYKSPEAQEREAAEAAQAEAQAQAQAVQDEAHAQARAAHAEARSQAQAVQDRAMREAQQQARLRERQAAHEERKAARAAERDRERQRDTAPVRSAQEQGSHGSAARTDDTRRPVDHQVESHHIARPSTGLGAQSAADAAAAKPIESYQPTQRDRSAQARAARPLKQEEVTEVAQAIAAESARSERSTEPVVVVQEEQAVEAVVAAEQKEERPLESGVPMPSVEEAPSRVEEQPAAPKGEPIALPEEPMPVQAVEQPFPPMPSVAEPVSAPQPEPAIPQSKPVDFTSAEFASSITAGAPEPSRTAPSSSKPAPTPHKVPVRTTEEIIKPVSAPVQLGIISPEAARHEAEAKKKIQSNERKIVKKVRRFRALGMLLIVIALAALAGAIFLFVAGNAQASESIETAATEISEKAGNTITYRYKAADSNGTLCPTTEVATFSQGDVLEQSVITMSTPDFETAAHTLANFKKQFQDSAYVDGRVDGSTVIFTLHMSNERIMKVTYTALLMTNTTGCEVIIN